MNCRMTRGIYLRANGEINCYCSTGEQITLAQLPLSGERLDFIEKFYRKDKFPFIREKMAADCLPFPDYCLKCNFLSPLGKFDPGLVDKEIEWIHVEPSALCNLKCPFCVHGIPSSQRVYSRPQPHFLPPELYRAMLEDIRSNGFSIKWMYFSGRGDPGMHPQAWRLVEDTKELFPDTNLLFCTNGNIAFHESIVDSGLDKIKIAVDSLDQETYARYRIGGRVEKLLALTKAIAERKRQTGSKTPQIIWQKVIFDFNDSREELLEYQQTAMEYGVDLIRILFSFTKGFSSTRPDDLEWIFPNVEIKDTYHRTNISFAELSENRRKAMESQSIDRHVKNINDILHWLELGMENRDMYNDYANIPLTDPRLYASREEDPNYAAFMQILRDSYGDLAAIYGQRGMPEQRDRYAEYRDSVPGN